MLKIITHQIKSCIKNVYKSFSLSFHFLDLITIKHRLPVGSILAHIHTCGERERDPAEKISKAKRVQIMIIVIKITRTYMNYTNKPYETKKAFRCLCA